MDGETILYIIKSFAYVHINLSRAEDLNFRSQCYFRATVELIKWK